MGTKIGIAFLAIIVIIVFVWMVVGVGEALKYDGLTDAQVRQVKAVRDSCELQAFMAGASYERVIEICEEQEAKLIEKFRTEG